METLNFIITETENGARLDQVLAKHYPVYSRAYFQHLIDQGLVQVNSTHKKQNYRVQAGDSIQITFVEQVSDMSLAAEEIPLNIIFENEDVIVLNKQSGLVVHPAAGNARGTLINALIAHFPPIKAAVIEKGSDLAKIRPGLVHRLDKDTSGVMVVAKNARAMHSLSRQIQNRTTKKIYLALCFGWPKEQNSEIVTRFIRDPHDRKKYTISKTEQGREAISDYEVIDYLTDSEGNKAALMQFNIKTGRTHQVRIHARYLGCPILGDATYGTRESAKLAQKLGISRQLLHAHELTFALPGSTKETTFSAPLPSDFVSALEHFKKVA